MHPFRVSCIAGALTLVVPLQDADARTTLDMLETAKSAVVQLKMQTAERRVFATGTAFLVGPDGLAVTNLHVLQNASSGVAVFPDSPAELPIEVLALDGEHDLGVIRLVLDARAARALPAPHPLPIREDEPTPGEDVWALGYPKGLGITVTKGIVNAIRTCEELPEYLCSEHASNSRWLQTDCTINSGNSGGPLIDGDGRLVGVSTWVWLEGQNMFFALSAQHVRELLRRVGDQPIGFDELARVSKTQRFVSRSIPSIDVPQATSARELKSVVARARPLFSCSTCKGSGTVTEHRTVHRTRRDGRVWRMGQDVTRDCSSCSKSGYSQGRKLSVAIRNVVSAIVEFDAVASNDHDVLRFFENNMFDIWNANPPALEALLTDECKDILSGRAETLGKPVMLIGSVADDLHFGDEHMWLANVVGRAVLVTDPKLANVLPGEKVLLGGYFAGYMTFSDGSSIAVIQHGFLLN